MYSKAADYSKTAFKRIVESYSGGFSTEIDVNNGLLPEIHIENTFPVRKPKNTKQPKEELLDIP